MPDGAVIKAFDAGMLREAKQVWAAAGRDPARLITVLRHFDVYTAPEGTVAEATAHWRAMYARWADATFFDNYAPFVDIVSESNEYTAMSTWTDVRETTKASNNMAGAANAWNTYYRGRNGIGEHVRVALMAGPVANGWPRHITQLAIDTDSYLDYHAYELCLDGARAADSWRWHSGLWHFLEQEHGLKPRWLFGESGPYRDAQMGWRHPQCLGGDAARLVAVMEAWWRDVATTPAYREGRIAGPGCWFTSGNVGWEYYQLETGQLTQLAQACRALWAPGTGEIDVTLDDLLAIRADAQHILDVTEKYVPPPAWWQQPVPYTFRAAPVNPLRLYRPDRVTVGAGLNYTGWEITVSAVDPAGWLLVVGGSTPAVTDDLWLRAADVTPI